MHSANISLIKRKVIIWTARKSINKELKLMRVGSFLSGLNISAVDISLCTTAVFTSVSEWVNATHGSSPHRCCQSSHHHHRTSIWWECISYCYTETVHPRTLSQCQFRYLRTTVKRITVVYLLFHSIQDNLQPSHERSAIYLLLHNNTWLNRANPNTMCFDQQFYYYTRTSKKPWQRKSFFLSVLFQTIKKMFLLGWWCSWNNKSYAATSSTFNILFVLRTSFLIKCYVCVYRQKCGNTRLQCARVESSVVSRIHEITNTASFTPSIKKASDNFMSKQREYNKPFAE